MFCWKIAEEMDIRCYISALARRAKADKEKKKKKTVARTVSVCPLL